MRPRALLGVVVLDAIARDDIIRPATVPTGPRK
jgi:hypothetical protein